VSEPEIAAIARLALAEFSADGLLVLDERPQPTRVVAGEGPAAASFGVAVADLPSLAAGSDSTVVVTNRGGSCVLSTTLDIGDGEPIGTMHVIYADEAAAPTGDQVRGLARAFARHIGLVLAHGALRTESDRREAIDDELVALDNLACTPHAIGEMTALVNEIVRSQIGSAAASIIVWDEETDVLRALPGAFGLEAGELQASVSGRVANLHRSSARVFATGQPYMSNSAGQDPGVLRAYADRLQVDRILTVPLNTGGRRTGVISLVNKPADFTVRDIAAVERIAPRIAMAVELARTIARLRTRQRLDAILATTAVSIATGQGVEACLLPALEQWCAVTDASLAALVPLSNPPLIWRARRADQALESRLIDDARTLEHRSAGAMPKTVGDPGWAALHAPVELSGERIATVSALRQTGEPFGPVEAEALGRLASLSALAWATEGYQRKLAELAGMRERERIADELHDRVAQILFAAQLGLDSMLESDDGTVIDKERITDIRALLTKGDSAIREVINRLGTVPKTGLARRLRIEVEAVESEFGVAIHVEMPDDELVNPIRGSVADCLVKVAREATVNAAKHAGKCRIGVNLDVQAEDRVVLTVLDDGLGAPDGIGTGRHGIGSLRRAVRDAGGTLRISRLGTGFGTRVTASFPI
jgi:signal transduction histidine kinase